MHAGAYFATAMAEGISPGANYPDADYGPMAFTYKFEHQALYIGAKIKGDDPRCVHMFNMENRDQRADYWRLRRKGELEIYEFQYTENSEPVRFNTDMEISWGTDEEIGWNGDKIPE